MIAGALYPLGNYGHGLGHVASVVAHAAIWSEVGRLVWKAPFLLVIMLVLGSVVYLLVRPDVHRRG